MNSSKPIPLTTDGLFKRDPIFWPGGTEIVYAALSLPNTPTQGRVRLMRLSLADRSVVLLHAQGPLTGEREISVSADGSRYAYADVEKVAVDPVATIVVKDLKSGQTLTTVRPYARSLVTRPTLSPDGKRIVFLDAFGGDTIKSLDLGNDEPPSAQAAKLKTLGERGDACPNFAADGSQLAFTSRRDNDFEIYVMNADGTKPRRLTHSKGIDTNPAFAPDGKQIAFTSNRSGNYEIYVMKADGSNVRRVTDQLERSDFACWHPDGQRMVFVGERNGRLDLYMIDVPG